MRTTFVGILAVGLLAATIAFSGSAPEPSPWKLTGEDRNPWSSDRLNDGPNMFRFAVVSDRTGAHRAKVFSQAVDRLNILQPEFVMSVGDLIEGGKKSAEKYAAEWDEFDGYVKKLTMPFFYVPGNHDAANKVGDKVWAERYGRRHYHFVYRNVLFLCLNSEDPNGTGKIGVSKEQLEYVKKAAADAKDAAWTLVFIHKPVWTGDTAANGWGELEKILSDRQYTVFCGHVHRYRKFVRNGRNLYQLATTGGGSKVRGIAYGEFDHVAWVTMTDKGPVIANVILDGVLPDDLKTPDSAEKGVNRARKAVHPVKGTVYLAGSPVAGALVTLVPIPPDKEKEEKADGVRADALTEGDGSFVPSTYSAQDGVAAGRYNVMVTKREQRTGPDAKAGPNLLPAKYADPAKSGLTVEVKPGANEFRLDLSR